MPTLRSTQPAPSSTRPSGLIRLWQALDFCGPYAGVAMLYLLALPLLSASRAALLVWQSERVAATGLWGTALLQGVRVDLIQVSLLSLPLLLLGPLLATRRSWGFWRGLNIAWVTLAIATLGLLES